AARERRDGRHGTFRREEKIRQISDDVLAATRDLHVLAALADDLGDGLRRVDLASKLVEVGRHDVRADLDGAFLGRQLAEHDPEQRALADAVVADDAEPVAAHDAQVEVLEQPPAAEAVRDAAYLDDLAAGKLLGLVDQDSRRARAFDALRA